MNFFLIVLTFWTRFISFFAQISIVCIQILENLIIKMKEYAIY